MDTTLNQAYHVFKVIIIKYTLGEQSNVNFLMYTCILKLMLDFA